MISIGLIASALHAHNGFCIQLATREDTYLHAHVEHIPQVFLHVVHLNRVVDLLLGAAKETSERIYELVVDCARREIVPLVFHRRQL